MDDSKKLNNTSGAIRDFALASLFAAIIFLMAFTPIGFIQLGLIKATIIHVPVIIGSVILGPKIGAFLGLLFGVTSLINNTMFPAVLSFAFSPLIPVPGTGHGSVLALAICFVPRILVGVVPYYVDQWLFALRRNSKGWRFATLFVAGVAGGMTNTLLVMHLIYFIFKDAYATARSVDPNTVYAMITSVIVIHGVPEAIVAGVFTSAVGRALLAYTARNTPGARI